MSGERVLAIDAWASCITPEAAKHWPDEFRHVFRRYGSIEKLVEGMRIETMLAEMDESGVDIAVLSAFVYKAVQVTNDMVAAWVRQYPKRFVGCGTVDPRDKPMRVLGEIKRMVHELGLAALRLEPYAYGDGVRGLPPNDRAYWPIYAACCELNIPVALQVGHSGPLLPSECGHPIYLDEVALAFPELKLIGAHIGQPWHEEMMILAWKHPNVYIDTSARPARRWPESFVEFVRGWGQNKVLWATDYPLLSFKRCLDDVEALGLEIEVKRKLLRENAQRVFGIA
ncbi:MAG: amidohydrolase family protein [Ardenticatenaceae bacterium]|nr:amidohydrolase family protein [Ardenticatenaceae bacterium]